jgi:glucose/arabinose dehydrogenase
MASNPPARPAKDNEPIMTTTTTLAAAAALALAAGTPALASAATAPPIAISNVQIEPAGGYANHYLPGIVTVAFRNAAGVAATSVTFQTSDDGATLATFTDAGTFAPGVTVKHSFLTLDDDAEQRLSVAEVRFADGTVWDNTDLPRALRQTAAASENIFGSVNQDF